MVVVGVSELGPDHVLPELVGEQDADGVRVEVDAAVLAAAVLGRPNACARAGGTRH